MHSTKKEKRSYEVKLIKFKELWLVIRVRKDANGEINIIVIDISQSKSEAQLLAKNLKAVFKQAEQSFEEIINNK